jgi:hypothetical protein
MPVHNVVARAGESGDPVFQSVNDGIEIVELPEYPLEPVIGLAEGETRWRGTTTTFVDIQSSR